MPREYLASTSDYASNAASDEKCILKHTNGRFPHDSDQGEYTKVSSYSKPQYGTVDKFYCIFSDHKLGEWAGLIWPSCNRGKNGLIIKLGP